MFDNMKKIINRVNRITCDVKIVSNECLNSSTVKQVILGQVSSLITYKSESLFILFHKLICIDKYNSLLFTRDEQILFTVSTTIQKC